MTRDVSAAHWADIGENTSVAGIRFLCAVHALAGRWPFRLCLYPVVLVYWLTSPLARHASQDYLHRLHAHARVFTRRPGWFQSLRHFAAFAETLLDKLLVSAGRYPVGQVRLEHAAVLDAVQAGRGGLIVTAHMGCLELCQALAGRVSGFRITILVHTAHAVRINRMFHRLGSMPGVELMQVTDLGPGAAAELARRVEAGQFVAIVGDRVPLRGGRSLSASFLGAPARFPIGAWVLASVLACPVFTLSCLHQSGGYVVRLQSLAERVVLPRGARDAALAGYVAGFVAWLEAQVLASPYDWFNFFDFWHQVDDGRATR